MKKDKDAEAKKAKSETFTATEVGAMMESIHKEIKIVAEGHSGLDKRLERLEVEVHGNSRRLDMVELTSRIAKDTGSRLEDAVSKLGKDLRAEIKDVREELKTTKDELKKDIHELGERLTGVEVRP